MKVNIMFLVSHFEKVGEGFFSFFIIFQFLYILKVEVERI